MQPGEVLRKEKVQSFTEAYSWDERNQLSTVNSPAYQFFYDAFGRRESFNDLGVVTSYIYDNLLAVQTNSTSNESFFTTLGDEVLAYIGSDGTFVPLTDVLGSAIGVVNSSGIVAATVSYEPFGVPTFGVTNY